MTLAIELEDLRKTFGHTVRALDGVSFGVDTGTIFGLLGPNGAGKTTVVRILTTVLRADSGVARVLGHDVTAEPAAVRTLIGLAGQFAAVDENLTGAENLWMVGRLNHMAKAQLRTRASQLLEQFGLSDAADRPTKTYSGGMRRRLDVAASLVAHPKVLFLDEPTTGLDPASRADVWAMIEDPRRRRNDGAPHDPVPRGGRQTRRAPCRDRPRQGDRGGNTRLLEGKHGRDRPRPRSRRGGDRPPGRRSAQSGEREGSGRLRPHRRGQRQRRPPHRHRGAEDSRSRRHRPRRPWPCASRASTTCSSLSRDTAPKPTRHRRPLPPQVLTDGDQDQSEAEA